MMTKPSFSLLLLLATACGSAARAEPAANAPAAPPSGTAPPVEPGSSAGTAPPAGTATAPDATPTADPAAPAAAPAPAAEPAPAGPPPSRDVVYKVTPEGLVVEADGVRFMPKAKPVKLANGGYGIRLEVTAKVIDERTHTLLGHAHGPLSIAAIIKDAKDQQQAHHSDSRGDGPRTGQLEVLQPGQDVVLTRSWPSGSVKGPLWWGQKVRLMVGLWGLGADDETPRPLRKLCTIDMVAGANATAVVSPPVP